MPHRTKPRYEARVQQRARREEQRPAQQPRSEREVVGRAQPRGDRWNTAPVLDPLVEMYRR
jgi:hypothetical protein